MTLLNRGSEWRKWDLHLHTPSSYDYKNRSVTNEQIVEALASAGIAVAAITDHHFIDCERIKKLQELSKAKHITILPGIEMKAEMRGDKPIHFIAIFSEAVDIAYIWGEISAKTNIAKYRSEGRPEEEIYCDLADTCELVHGLDGLISIHAGSKTNSIETITNSLPLKMAQKRDIVECVDIYELGKTDDQKGYIDSVFPCIGREIPMIMCSDNHNIAEYGFKESCWIKAEPTFEGLRQITFEPLSRARLLQYEPEPKTPYVVIDSVRFVDNRRSPEFQPTWIPLNRNLNSIIGGKSSGKSILLYHIAKTIDSDRIDAINSENTFHKPIEYRYEQDAEFDFEVRWSDGATYSLKSPDKPNRPITYIPQLFLNQLAEDQKDELNALVEKMLLDSYPTYGEFRRASITRIDNLKTEVFTAIEDYQKTKRQLNEKQAELKDLGDSKAIAENIAGIHDEIEKLRSESEFTEEEEIEYVALSSQKQTLTSSITDIESSIRVLKELKTGVEKLKDDIERVLEQEIRTRVPSLKSITKEDILTLAQKVISLTAVRVSKALESSLSEDFAELDTLEKRLENDRNKLAAFNNSLVPLSDKVKNRSSYESTQKRLKDESAKLKALTDKNAEVEALQKKLTIEPIIATYGKLFQQYADILDKHAEFKSVPEADNLEIQANLICSDASFDQNFLGKVDRRTALTEQLGPYFNIESKYIFKFSGHLNAIKQMAEHLVMGTVSLKKGVDEKHALLSLFDDYFSIDYNLLQDGDDLLMMSPGKRGIILFQLFLHLNKSTNPILIDQPEDNLDNRTVFQELSDFLKTKKTRRQIIIVSHNPNLVVSTDSENVIVANQAGQNKSGNNQKYKFEYVNGALEHSFRDISAVGVLFKCGIREHVCDILEGGLVAFKMRETKYGLK